MNDQQTEQNYRQAMGLDCQDASRHFYLKAIKERAKLKGYKITGFSKMSKEQLYAIFNQSNNLSK